VNSPIQWPHYLFLLILVFFFCYIGLGAYYIIDTNEGLYAEVSREMLLSGNYVIPHLNQVPYIEKPPLLYWLITVSYKIFGVSAFSARFVPATAMMLTVLSTWWFGCKIQLPRVGWIAAVMLSSSIGFWLIGRTILFDMLLTFLMGMGLYLFYVWFSTGRPWYLRLSYVFFALAILCKGFLVVLIGSLIVLLFLLWTQSFKQKFLKLFELYGLLLFFTIVLPWHLLAVHAQPGFAWFYFMNEHINRFLDTRYPHDYHSGSYFYYLPRILAYIFPWSLLLPFFLNKIVGMSGWIPASKQSAGYSRLKKFLYLWVFIPLIFFSLAGDKGDYYMVISVPALIFLLALRLENLFINRITFPFTLALIVNVLAGVAGFGLLIIAFYSPNHFGQRILISSHSIMPILGYTLLIIYAVVSVKLIFKHKNNPTLSFCLLAASVLPITFLFTIAKQQLQVNYTQQNIASYILNQQKAGDHRSVFLFQDYEKMSSLGFYLQQPIVIIDTQSEDLDYGRYTESGKKRFISSEVFARKVRKEKVYVVMEASNFDDFNNMVEPKNRKQEIHFCILAQTAKAILVGNDGGCE
jgi:4-amino-4-deoxy-L-arabinose transferase-like glycosyltransferase